MKNPIYLAIDTAEAWRARQIIENVREFIGGIKVGLTFLYANGPGVASWLVEGSEWFFDAKIHDIPIQAAGAVRSIMSARPNYISLHIGEMKENASEAERWSEDLMIRAAVAAADEEAVKMHLPRPKLLGVTKLTHLPATDTEVVARAHRGLKSGLDGIICSPLELRILRSELGTKPILLTPSVRLDAVTDDDQLRTATPRQAIEWGANIIVVGRPVTNAPVPRDAAKAIWDSLQ